MDYFNTSAGYFQSWGDAFAVSMQNAWLMVASYLPQLLGAIIILIIGLLLSGMLGKFAKKLVSYTRIDGLLQKMNVKQELEKFEIKLSFADLVGWVVKWFFIIVTLIAVVDTLGISQITAFFEEVLLYLPNVIAAIFILAIGLVLGRFVQDLVAKAVAASQMQAGMRTMLAPVAKWAIVVFALMAALVQLGIAPDLIRILFSGFVFMLALAGGLAFGLGGREQAAKLLGKMGSGPRM